MSSPIVTLLTDFGLKDHYVGTMKGVILSHCPGAQLVDLSHEVPAFSLHEGAYALSQSSPYFPSGTVHCVVVDPGVGTNRRAVVVEANSQFFVAPDNGVLSLVLQNAPAYRAYAVTNRNLFLPSLSSTFHGRDIFAPVAAAIASRKIEPSGVGPPVKNLILLTGLQSTSGQGIVLSVDHFGNIITNVSVDSYTEGCALQIASRTISTFRKTFAEAVPNELFLYPGSSGYLEIGVNQGRAADLLCVCAGDAVSLECAP